MEIKPPLRFYSKKHEGRELSNFYPSPFESDGVIWPTVEHYFQAQKFLDPTHRGRIRIAGSPGEAKLLGRTKRPKIREDWNYIKDSIMRYAIKKKFLSSDFLYDYLLSTQGRELIEDSPTDYYWGCGAENDGLNMLGKLLMELRDSLTAREANG
jgi:ribA/ribD-fused uncharacterized protein